MKNSYAMSVFDGDTFIGEIVCSGWFLDAEEAFRKMIDYAEKESGIRVLTSDFRRV